MKNPFDSIAASYDVEFSTTALGYYYRGRVQQVMKKHWPGNRKILELNAGTGEDAVFLAGLGNEVLLTDNSINMLSRAQEKLKQKGLMKACKTRVLPIEQLGLLAGELYDGLLSNFGGLNCVSDLQNFSVNARALIRSKGIMILCIMGPFVPWEWIWFSVQGKFGKAFRRLQSHTPWRGINIYYPPVQYAKRILMRASFRCIHQEGLGVVMPPSYVNALVNKFPRSFGFLGKVETLLSELPMAPYFADHYLLVMEKD